MNRENNYLFQIAKILRAKEVDIAAFFSKMEAVTGKKGIAQEIISENNALVERTLLELGINSNNESRVIPGIAEKIYNSLIDHLIESDKKLFEILGRPDLSRQESIVSMMQAKYLSGIHKGFFMKENKAKELVLKNPPMTVIKALGYNDADELLEKETVWEVYAALRFLEPRDWMNKVFLEAYKKLKPEDFEEREIKMFILPEKWLALTEKFMEKKYHNVSHLKELGVIFIIPILLDIPGDTIRLFALLLHYLHEVPFYSKLFQAYGQEGEKFSENLIALLRGDVLEGPLPDAGNGKINIRIVQRYLSKDDPQDPRLFEPHINPETRHWDLAESDLAKLGHEYPELHMGFWSGLNWVGDSFLNENGEEVMVEMNLIDVVMSLAKKRTMLKYLYHRQEAFWNQIFMKYLGIKEVDKLIYENIIKGYITLG